MAQCSFLRNLRAMSDIPIFSPGCFLGRGAVEEEGKGRCRRRAGRRGGLADKRTSKDRECCLLIVLAAADQASASYWRPGKAVEVV